MTRPRLVAALAGGLLAACSAATPLPTASPSGSSAPTADSSPPATTTPEPSQQLSPSPGKPFDASEVLAAMRDSRRPGGVPDELETDAIAAAVADKLWTFDGAPWTTIVAGGSCGPETCTLEMSGAPPDAVAEDLWVFEVTLATRQVAVGSTNLRGIDAQTLQLADEIVRTSAENPGTETLLGSARWLPPPDDHLLVLSYRTGAETGTCGLDVTVDRQTESVVDAVTVAC